MANIITRFGNGLDAFAGAMKGDANKAVTPSAPQPVSAPSIISEEPRVTFVGQEVKMLKMGSVIDIDKALRECPPVTYILYKKALAFANGIMRIYDQKGQLMTDPMRFRYYKLLQTPNILQSDIQFRIQVHMMTQAFGYCPVLKIRSALGDILSMWVLPPKYVTFKRSGKLLQQNKYHEIWDEIRFNNKPLPKEDIYVFTDITPYYNDLLLPESRMAALGPVVTNVAANYKTRANLMANRGAIGVLANETEDKMGHVDLTEKEKEDLQKDYQMKYNLTTSDWNIIITNKKMTWVPMSYPIKDLMMTEQEEHDIKTICATLGYPHPLLPFGANTAHNNQITSERTLYENAILPEGMNYDMQLNDCLETATLNASVAYDFSHIKALQADELLKVRTESIHTGTVRTQWLMNAITYNQMLVLLGLDEVGNGNYYYRDSQEYKDTIQSQSNQNSSDEGGTK